MLGDKIRELRCAMGLSQEGLAERLHVSRQAVTKWETGAGVPDVENLMGIADVFGLSMDELLGRVLETRPVGDVVLDGYPTNVSRTEYDIDRVKDYDINLGAARSVVLQGVPDEKLVVCLSSQDIEAVASSFKVRIDDGDERIDVDVRRAPGVSETLTREVLDVYLGIPATLVRRIELAVNAEKVEARALLAEGFEDLELGGRLHRVMVEDVDAHVEIDSNEDLIVECPKGLPPRLDVNQLWATSRLVVPEGTVLNCWAKGLGTRVFVGDGVENRSGEAGDCTVPGVELNGVRSELTVEAAGE